MAGQDEVRRAHSMPIDNPLVPPFPIAFRNSPYLYLEEDGPVSAGREVYGQPKKAGEPSLEVWYDYLKR